MATPTPDPSRGAMYFDEEQGKWVYFAEEIAKAEVLRKKAVNKGYNDLPYAREVVSKSDVLSLIREALGFNAGQASQLVYDGKVTPVVVLNDLYSYKSWVVKTVYDAWAVFGVHDITCLMDNYGNLFAQSDDGNHSGCLDINGVFNNWMIGGSAEIFSYDGLGYDRVVNQCKRYLVTINNLTFDSFIVHDKGVQIFVQHVPDYDAAINTLGCVSISPNGKYIGVSAYTGAKDYLIVYEGVV